MRERTDLEYKLNALQKLERDLEDAITLIELGEAEDDEATIAELERDKRVAFRYVGDNPNGSMHDIAGIYGGPKRNVLGLMPHPERACEPALGSADGKKILTSITRAILAR